MDPFEVTPAVETPVVTSPEPLEPPAVVPAEAPAVDENGDIPGWPGVKPETAEEHDARRRAEQASGTP